MLGTLGYPVYVGSLWYCGYHRFIAIGNRAHRASHKYRPRMVSHRRRRSFGSDGESSLDRRGIHRVLLFHRAEKRILYKHAMGTAQRRQ